MLRCAIAFVAAAIIGSADARSTIAGRVMTLTRSARWTLVATLPMDFRTFHPQGMAKVGDVFFVSSVEIAVPTAPLVPAAGGYDRSAGEGTGHLFKIDRNGHLIGDLKLGDGSIYHPGGIDFDGRHIWVPVAEYRPNSRAVIYRVDPETMKAEEVFRFADHIGAIVHDTDDRVLVGVSWGSRRFYRWPLGRDGRVSNAAGRRQQPTLNPSHYVDYQDCKYVGARRMLCTGVTEMRQRPEAAPFRLGGMDLVSLVDGRPLHQVPVLLWTPAGMDMTHNPVWIEPTATGLRAYFMPEDDRSTLYVYEVPAGP
jgi:hypothetical protein